MLKILLLSICFSLLLCLISWDNTFAYDGNVVISQIQLGNSNSAKNEFIELYNNQDTFVDITNWCLYYLSSGLVSKKLTCFSSSSENTRLYIPGFSTAFVVSNDLEASAVPIFGDYSFSATLSGSAGYVKLVDDLGVEIDYVGWGNDELVADLVDVPVAGEVISRKIDSEKEKTLQDTGINSLDFEITVPKLIYSYGSLQERVDVCNNIDDFQEYLPEGYVFDLEGGCIQEQIVVIDVCQNIDGIQETIPDGMIFDEYDDCVVDELNGDYTEDIDEDDEDNEVIDVEDEPTEKVIFPLQITELLPNAIGNDVGNEFIEIYNPNADEIILDNYVLYVNASKYNFPIGLSVGAGEYFAIYNNIIRYTLLNSTSIVRIELKDGTLIDEVPSYNSPKDNMSWSLIDGLWQYTNQPTPNSSNLVSLVFEENIDDIDELDEESNLVPCAPNQYRNPITNRCNLIVKASSTVVPCKEGQYRSEETGRCRNIVSDVISYVPCAEGEERNPETNRCRKVEVLGVSSLGDCPEGQERNPETNRCRNVIKDIPKADYKPEQVMATVDNSILWWSLGGLGFIAVLYGIWEWRQEIIKIFKKITSLLHIVK